MNVNTFEISETYVIDPMHGMGYSLLLKVKDSSEEDQAVVGIQQNSEKEDILLIGYLNGVLVTWNLDTGYMNNMINKQESGNEVQASRKKEVELLMLFS